MTPITLELLYTVPHHSCAPSEIHAFLENAYFKIVDRHGDIYALIKDKGSLHFTCWANDAKGMSCSYTTIIGPSDIRNDVRAIGHCVAQAMCDGNGLQDQEDVYGAFTKGFAPFL